ncbi:MAG: DUF4080 domain-containing protein [Clostridia bacterium]
MKVLLCTLNSKYSHTNIALYYLKNCIADLCNVFIHQFSINDDLDKIVESIISYNSDVVCFGCYIWNIEQTLKVAKNINNINNTIKICFGGPEVSYNPNEILKNNTFVTSIMCGEGENNIKSLICDLLKGDAKQIYRIPVDVKDIPSISDDIISYYDNRVVYFETSRGCPYRCSYCLSCIDKNIKYFDLDKVKSDLKKLLDKNVKQIRFIDRTFNSNRSRALEIWKFLIENRIDTTFHFEICVNLINEETLKFLETVPKDIFQFEIGVQSTNKETLDSINRGYKWIEEKKLIKKIKSFNNIKIHADLIIGLPFENIDIFKNSFNDLYDASPDELQIGFLKLLKGTDLYEKKDEYDYKFNNYPPYEVLENKFMSYEVIRYLKKFEEVFELYHNSLYFKNTIKILDSIFTNPFEIYKKIVDYFSINDLFSRKISTDECFLILINIFKETEYFNILQQSLTYDYFLKFKGTRDWFYTKYTKTLKKDINEFINKNKNLFIKCNTNSDIHKKYRFCILDYEFNINKEKEKTIYYKEK